MTVGSAKKLERLAIVAAICAALGLSGCGRKGALDAPPSALNNASAGTEVAPADEAGTVLRAGSDKQLPVIRGPNKRIPLDALID